MWQWHDCLNVTQPIPEEIKWNGTVTAVSGLRGNQLVERWRKEGWEVDKLVKQTHKYLLGTDSRCSG